MQFECERKSVRNSSSRKIGRKSTKLKKEGTNRHTRESERLFWVEEKYPVLQKSRSPLYVCVKGVIQREVAAVAPSVALVQTASVALADIIRRQQQLAAAPRLNDFQNQQ